MPHGITEIGEGMYWYYGEGFKESFNEKAVPYSACVTERQVFFAYLADICALWTL